MYPVLIFDKKRLQQVLLNLLLRVIKHYNEGVITITAFIHWTNFENGMLEVQVCDRGTGMNQDEIQSAFEPAEIEIPSTGLQRPKIGLNICRKICENLGGEMSVISRQNVGSRFKFTM